MPPPDPEYRRDPVTGQWQVLAPERATRPLTLGGETSRRAEHPGDPGRCPFCEGQEDQTTREVYAVRPTGTPANGPGWLLRVFPNRYPSVRPCATGPAADGSGLFHAGPGHGRHEVVADCPHHEENPARLSTAQHRLALIAYRERMLAHAADPAVGYVSIFKNVGAEAGASLAHSHAQIVAAPPVPEPVRQELDAARAHFERTGRCVFCHLLADELAAGERVVAETPGFVAVCPFAGRVSFEVWVLPRRHAPRYESLTDAEAGELADLLRRVLGAVDAAADRPAYNYYLHTTPTRGGEPAYYHWHLEVLPRTTVTAGFEWGFGFHVVTVPPEQAAARLRAALPPGGSP